MGVADLPFFVGPSPSKNEYWLAMPTKSIIPSGRGRAFFLDCLLILRVRVAKEATTQIQTSDMGETYKQGRSTMNMDGRYWEWKMRWPSANEEATAVKY